MLDGLNTPGASDWNARGSASGWEDGWDDWRWRSQVPEPPPKKKRKNKKALRKKKEGPDGYYTHGYNEEQAVGRRNMRPIKSKWAPEEKVLIGFVPFSIARDLPEKGGEEGNVWQEICDEIRDLSCTIQVSSKSKNAKGAKKGFQPRPHSKVHRRVVQSSLASAPRIHQQLQARWLSA